MTKNRVHLTADKLLEAVAPLVADMGAGLPGDELYRRLLESLRVLLPCDAAALLPLEVDGLSRDTLGRRFRIAEHPRFAALLGSGGPLRFPSDSPLPDPYDGL